MKPAIQTPLLDSLQTVLMPYRGKPVFFEALHGNNGDRLIEMGSRELLAQLGIIGLKATPNRCCCCCGWCRRWGGCNLKKYRWQ